MWRENCLFRSFWIFGFLDFIFIFLIFFPSPSRNPAQCHPLHLRSTFTVPSHLSRGSVNRFRAFVLALWFISTGPLP